MPKRTNEFQQLIYAIELQLNNNAIVTESKFLSDWATGDEREADIVIETEVGQRIIKVTECRDHARPQDIQWVDQMYGKHAHIAHKLVLVSKSGFTSSARRKAEALSIETLTIEEAKEVDWTQVVGKLARVYIKLPDIKVTHVGIYPLLGKAIVDQETLQLYDPQGISQGEPSKIGYSACGSPFVHDYILSTFREPGNYVFGLDYTPAKGSHLADKSGTKYSVEKLRFAIEIHIDTPIPVDLQHGSYKNAQVAYGTLKHPEVQGQLTIVETFGKPLSADLALKENKHNH